MESEPPYLGDLLAMVINHLTNWDDPPSRWWFQIFFFHPYLGRWSYFDDQIFSDGLVQPPTRGFFGETLGPTVDKHNLV